MTLLRSEMFCVVIAVVFMFRAASPAFGQLPGNREFGSILNNDASNIMYAGTGADTTPDEFRKGVGHLLDARPGLLAQSSGQSDLVFYRSNVATPFSKYVEETNRMVPAMRRFAELGTDPLQLTIEVCRQRGVPIVVSYRINAEDMGPRGGAKAGRCCRSRSPATRRSPPWNWNNIGARPGT